MGRGFAKIWELLSLTNLQTSVGEEQKKVFPHFKRIILINFELYYGVNFLMGSFY